MIVTTFILGALIVFMSGDEEVDWFNLVVLMALIMVVRIVFFRGLDPLAGLIVYSLLLFLGLMFFMKIPPANSLKILGALIVVEIVLVLLPL
ncbi:MAG: hypothetical protein AAGA58_00335 [Verrucomicrobiota bacterium]